MSVKRWLISSSSRCRSRSLRLMMVTSVPRAPKKWPSSAPMYPPPRIAMRCGCRDNRMMVSEVSSPGALSAPLQQCHWRAHGESPALDHGAVERHAAVELLNQASQDAQVLLLCVWIVRGHDTPPAHLGDFDDRLPQAEATPRPLSLCQALHSRQHYIRPQPTVIHPKLRNGTVCGHQER